MGQLFAFAILVLATCVSFAQPAPDKASPSPPSGAQKGAPLGGGGIPPELRSGASKDVPMGNGKPKASGAAPGEGRNDKRGK